MTQSVYDFQQQLLGLKQRGARLSEALARCAAELHSQGLAPSQELVDELQQFQLLFQEVRSRLPATGNGPYAQTLIELENAGNALIRRQQALDVVESLLALRHAVDAQFAPLLRCHEVCRALRDELDVLPVVQSAEKAQAELDESRPLGALSVLVQRADQIDDERYSTLQECVASAFGRDLATAVARGRLTVAQRL